MLKAFIPLLVKCLDPLIGVQRWHQLEAVLDQMGQIEDLFFVQIGANDGVVHDPLYRHVVRNNWGGILVEPVGYYFDRLKKNYAGNDRLVFENVAISCSDEPRKLFRIREGLDFLPNWTKGLGSFNRQVVMKHRWLIPNIRQLIVEEQVECISLETLMRRNAVEKIDLLMIDTEGYDWEIIKQIDFTRVQPKVIIYEHKHLTKTEKLACETLLRDRNYILKRHFSNTMACAL